MGLTDSYAYFLPIHALYQIVSIKLCHNTKIRKTSTLNRKIAAKPIQTGGMHLLNRRESRKAKRAN